MAELGFTPQYKVIADRIREDILSGKYPPDTRLQPDTEIAREYGVNKRTVANGMALLVADGLISRTPGRGSVVVRREAVVRKSNAIGVINRTSGDLYSKMEEVITEQVLKCNFYPMMVPDSLYDKAVCTRAYHPFRKLLEHFINDCPYGMIVHGERFIPYDLLERNREKVGHLVFITDYLHSKKLNAKYVLIDYRKAAEKIVAHLGENGHRKITMLTSFMYSEVTEESITPQSVLMNHLADAAAKAGIEFVQEIPRRLFSAENPEAVIREYFPASGITAAVLGFDSMWPNYLEKCFAKLGMSMPEDISIVGFYNTPWAERCNLTSVNVHEDIIAKTAVEALFRSSGTMEEILIEPDLVKRKSVSKFI